MLYCIWQGGDSNLQGLITSHIPLLQAQRTAWIQGGFLKSLCYLQPSIGLLPCRGDAFPLSSAF